MIVRWFEKHYKLSFLIAIVIAIMIYYISSLQGGGSGTGSRPWIPTAYHLVAFFFLTAFMMLAIVQGKHKEFLLPTVIIGLIYAVFDEFHQLFVPGRHFSFFDIFLDGLGVILAMILYIAMLWVRE